MKKKTVFLTLAAIVAALVLIYKITDCGACITEDDYAFMAKVKERLKKPGDYIKVSDIHPGEWIQVCAGGGGYNTNFASRWNPKGPDLPDKKVLNDADPTVSDKYDESAIIFDYDPETIEVYRMTPDKIVYWGSKGCHEKADAYLVVVSDENEFSEENRKRIGIPDDYITIEVVSKKEIDNGP